MRIRPGLALGLCLAAAAAMAAPATALASGPIEAVFFQEFASDHFTVDQGEIVAFRNHDPFLAHGVVSDDEEAGEALFSAPVISPEKTRLVYGAPFLTTGTYDFHCPVHPEMTSTLEVTANGSPLPPDATPPTAVVKLKRGRLAGLLNRRRIRFTIDPAEAADAAITVRAGGVTLARADRTYLSAGQRRLRLRASRAAIGDLRARIAELKSRHKLFVKLVVSAALTDVAANTSTSRGARRLRIPIPRPRPEPKPKT
jgi:plastocyanin